MIPARADDVYIACSSNHPRTTMKTPALYLALALLLATPASAQDVDWSTTRPDPTTPQGENMAVPEGWHFRLDRPNPDTRLIAESDAGHDNIHFVNMTPGWHVTTGPAAILYHPALTVSGPYRARAEYHLFPPGDRNEAFGLFVGGSNLDADDQSYLYFLIRKSGEFLIKRRDGSETSVVKDWTAHPSIVPHTAETTGSVKNVLAVTRESDALTFYVNGTEVATVPPDDLPVDGVVGLRVNHALNVHVSDLAAEPLD